MTDNPQPPAAKSGLWPLSKNSKLRRKPTIGFYVLAAFLALTIILGALGALDEPELATTPTVAVTTTTARPTTTRVIPKTWFENCVSSWDGNWEQLEAEIRAVLNDPDSMKTLGTYYNPTDDISDNTLTIRLEYTAKNGFGGTVRTDAIAEMKRNCEVGTIITYGT